MHQWPVHLLRTRSPQGVRCLFEANFSDLLDDYEPISESDIPRRGGPHDLALAEIKRPVSIRAEIRRDHHGAGL